MPGPPQWTPTVPPSLGFAWLTAQVDGTEAVPFWWTLRCAPTFVD